MTMVVTWQVNICMLVLSVIMCICAGFVSVRKINRIDPALLFRG